MKTPCLGLLASLLGISCPAITTAAAEPAASTDWKLVWSDEFSRDGLPDASKWGYERGFVRNQELQYYTAGKRENARVEDGMLVIEAHPAHLPNPAFRPDASPRRWQQHREYATFTSASLTTRETASWTYGRIEVRAKVPAARGTWPAIWMLGKNIGEVGWPACGEIDILEHVGHEPGVVFANVHTRGYNHTRGNGRGSRLEVPTAETEFHVYAVEWTRERMDFLVDGQKYFTLKNDGTGVDSWPFDAPHYLILNLAVGGSWGGAKGVDQAAFPQRFLIDYVRIYQREEG
jgi:beta-glucanase (GH16 family)